MLENPEMNISQPKVEDKEEIHDKRYGADCYAKREVLEMENGSKIDFLKVRHTEKTLKEFKAEITQHIANADVLLSELAVFENDENQDDIHIFYKKITQLAKENHKKMVVADPEKIFSTALANRAVSIVPALASMGSGVYLGKKLMDIASELEMRQMRKKYDLPEVSKNKDDKLISRREFLKGVLATGVMMAGGLHGIAGMLEEMRISEEKGKLLETFLLDSLDYRNALITKELINLSEKNKKVAVIYGAAHISGIKKFLNNPDLLEEKLKVYRNTYGLFNDEQTDVYDFSSQK